MRPDKEGTLAYFREQAKVENVPICDCTNEELEEGRTCDQPHCQPVGTNVTSTGGSGSRP